MTLAFRLFLRLLPLGATAASVAWLLMYAPFATPLVDRSLERIEADITRELAREVDMAWLLPRLQEAILTKDIMQLDLLLGLANDHGIRLPPAMLDDIIAIDAAASAPLARMTACGACAVDVSACVTLAQIGTCALPFEMTPAGDINALRRAGGDYLAGEQIDRLDVGLAVVGLGATGAVLASGGSSYSIKAGTSLLRMARRLGTLTPALTTRLSRLVGDAVRWDRMGDLARLDIPPRQMVDATKLAELADLGGSLRRVAANTSVAETVSLLRYVDGPQDGARLARVSDALGPKTRGAFDVLGKQRVFRAMVRLSDLAIASAAAIYALGLQVLMALAHGVGSLCLRGLARLVR